MNNTGIDANDIFSLRDKGLPPLVLDILFEFGAERSIVVKAGVAIVDFARRKDDAAAFAETDDILHAVVDLERRDLGGFRRGGAAGTKATRRQSNHCHSRRHGYRRKGATQDRHGAE